MKPPRTLLFLRTVIVLSLCLVPTVTSAHPGHGVESENGLLHYVLSPMHSVPVLTALAIGVFVIRRLLTSGSRHDES